jgi:hypothetical protein
MVRNEYKLWMYKEYLLPSKCFLLTVHNLTKTQLKTLDTLTESILRNGQGSPKVQLMHLYI